MLFDYSTEYLQTKHCPNPSYSLPLFSGCIEWWSLLVKGKPIIAAIFSQYWNLTNLVFVKFSSWVAPCHFCTFLPDQFFLALFCLNIVSWIPCGAFWPNLATSAHFKGLFYPWMDSGVNLGPKFQLKPWANFSNFFGSFCT